MTYADIKTMLDTVEISEGVPVPNAYYQFDENTGIKAPFICFYNTGSQDVYADNSNYRKIDHLVVELYTKYKDFQMEAALEGAFRSSGLTWTREETHLDDESLYVEVYDLDIIITEEEDNAE